MYLNDDDAIPYDISIDALEKMMELVGNSGGVIDPQKIRNVQIPSFRGVLKACLWMNLLIKQDGKYVLSDFGRKFAYSNVPTKPTIYQQLIKNFRPYAIILEEFLAKGRKKISKTDVRNLWGVNNFKISQRRLDTALPFLFAVFERAGLGTYKRGGRNSETNFEFALEFQTPKLKNDPPIYIGNKTRIVQKMEDYSHSSSGIKTNADNLKTKVNRTELPDSLEPLKFFEIDITNDMS